MDTPEDQDSNAVATLVRLVWLFLGPAGMFFSVVLILERKPSLPSWADGLYCFSVAATLLARFVDIRFLAGTTAQGNLPATTADLRTFAGLVVTAGILTWVFARGLQLYLSGL